MKITNNSERGGDEGELGLEKIKVEHRDKVK
jgi:hypothetical protein